MTKKIILASSILAVAVLISGAILMAAGHAEAAAINNGKATGGCRTVCTPTYSETDGWESNCFVDCPNNL